jgi:anti-anti-sigma factor
VELHGEIDVHAAPPGSDFLDGTPGARADTVVDLRHVTFIDGSGLNALLRTAVRLSAARHRLAVVVTDPLHRRLLYLVGLGPDTTVYTTVPEADPVPDAPPPRQGHDTPVTGTAGGGLRTG